MFKEKAKGFKGSLNPLHTFQLLRPVIGGSKLTGKYRFRFLKILRAKEWWEHKLVPILTIGYIEVYLSGRELLPYAGTLLFSMMALVVGASYVSVINDITDTRDDQVCGKENRMLLISPKWRLLFPALFLLLGAILFTRLLENYLSAVLYLLSWISFSCYSIPPVRLKKRYFWGVLADACGSQLFPSLFILSYTGYKTGQPFNGFLFYSVALWSFAYGLRGILWHQLFDKTNDLRTGLKTAGTQVSSAAEKKLTLIILGTELLGLTGLLRCIRIPLAIIFLFLYVVFSFLLARVMKKRMIIIRSPHDVPYRMLLSDYYGVFLPVAVLASAAIRFPSSAVVILFHILLFPGNIVRIAVETKCMISRLLLLKGEKYL